MDDSEPSRGASETKSLAFDLRYAASSFVRVLSKARPASSELTAAQVSLLAWLFRNGDLLVGQLARYESMRPQSMTQAVNRLQKKGFVSRRPDDLDARQVVVSLTPLGRQKLLEDRKQREEWLAKRLDTFSQEEFDAVKKATPLLRRLSEL